MQITAFYIFHITPKHQYSALVKMAYAGFLLRRAKGCSFAKIMGSGGGSLGFGLSPNFKLYASIMVWDSLEQMKKYWPNKSTRKGERNQQAKVKKYKHNI